MVPVTKEAQFHYLLVGGQMGGSHRATAGVRGAMRVAAGEVVARKIRELTEGTRTRVTELLGICRTYYPTHCTFQTEAVSETIYVVGILPRAAHGFVFTFQHKIVLFIIGFAAVNLRGKIWTNLYLRAQFIRGPLWRACVDCYLLEAFGMRQRPPSN
ncbi:hypothetical protein B0H19DRAFT_1060396 [Mycena capillaripes]|nr:hypothetical protein B0H19DRAFT_1060396 [Mycena capillaripes]